jgi:hypothetical protein
MYRPVREPTEALFTLSGTVFDPDPVDGHEAQTICRSCPQLLSPGAAICHSFRGIGQFCATAGKPGPVVPPKHFAFTPMVQPDFFQAVRFFLMFLKPPQRPFAPIL